MDLGLEGRVAIVTGASRGIGLAVVQALVAEGARVVAAARRPGAVLEALAADGRVVPVALDLTAPDAPDRLVAAAGDRLDVLVNNVGGVHARTDGFLGITDEQWADSLTLNFLAAVRTTRAALPALLAGGGGSIVNIGSVNAVHPDALVLDYSAAKAALHAFSKGLSKEVGPAGVRVNTISPGPVATDIWLGAGGFADTVGAASGGRPEDVVNGAAAALVTGRFSRPEEVANLVVLLASADRVGNVTGSDFRIDGGYVPTW
ncbi:SDR family oxidoreductase [Catenulispora yoronensis]|uniref:SDR family oxidoreductase n=1 Tax=Catenulispora yoronensis TaxID=450799 RepID=A0ABN2V3V4_9ACTN